MNPERIEKEFEAYMQTQFPNYKKEYHKDMIWRNELQHAYISGMQLGLAAAKEILNEETRKT